MNKSPLPPQNYTLSPKNIYKPQKRKNYMGFCKKYTSHSRPIRQIIPTRFIAALESPEHPILTTYIKLIYRVLTTIYISD